MSSPPIAQIINWLWRPVEGKVPLKVYAVVDAARSALIYPKIMSSGIESACLHRGEKGRELAWVAPYLVGLRMEDPFTTWFLENGWGNSWGIFVNSAATFNKVKQHFQTFLTVYDEDGNAFFFRFYDPRVMRVYLPTCNAEEIQKIFGVVENFMLEEKDPSCLRAFAHQGDTLKTEKIVLGQ